MIIVINVIIGAGEVVNNKSLGLIWNYGKKSSKEGRALAVSASLYSLSITSNHLL